MEKFDWSAHKWEGHLSPICRPDGISPHFTGCRRHPALSSYALGATSTSTRACVRDANADPLQDDPASLQSQSMDSATHARVIPLPSIATISSSSGELHLYIDSDTSPPTQMGPTSSSHELLISSQTVPQSQQLLFPASRLPFSVTQPPPQPRTALLGLVKLLRHNRVGQHPRI